MTHAKLEQLADKIEYEHRDERTVLIFSVAGIPFRALATVDLAGIFAVECLNPQELIERLHAQTFGQALNLPVDPTDDPDFKTFSENLPIEGLGYWYNSDAFARTDQGTP